MARYCLLFNKGEVHRLEIEAEDEDAAWERGYRIVSGQEAAEFHRLDLNEFDIFHVCSIGEG